jgi:hypothetical protein
MEQTPDKHLLTYVVSTDPAPLRVKAPGTVTILVKPDPSVRCKLITVRVLIGDGATDLFLTAPAPTESHTEWTLPPPGLGLLPTISFLKLAQNYATWHFWNQDSPDNSVAEGFCVTISGTINSALGTAVVEIEETSAAASETSFSLKKVTFDMNKTEASDLYIKSFYAGPGLLPVTEYANGDPIRLTWESNCTNFKVYQKGSATPVFKGSEKSCPLDGIHTDTTFTLDAWVENDAGHTNHLYEALTITVSNPSLTPNKVDVSGPVTIAEKLAVKGPVTIAGSNVLEFGVGVAGKEQETGKIGCGTDSLDITGAGSSTNRQIKFLSEGGASFTGNIKLEAKNDLTLVDWNHGIGYYGGEKHWGTDDNQKDYSPNGPVVYGWNGGVLGTTANGKKSVLVWQSDGRVGIGTSGPNAMLHVNGRVQIGSWGSPPAELDVMGDTYVSGKVGIGTVAPEYPLDVTNTNTQDRLNVGYAFLANKGDEKQVAGKSSNADNISIRAKGRIVGDEFNAISDARIKTVVSSSDVDTDLALLRRLRITDYTMRDQVQYGDKAFKKIIAQELEEVFPQAVSQHTSFLPDIYARPTQVQQQGDALLLTLPAGLPEAATAGQRLKLIGPAGEVVATLAEAAEAGSQQLVVTGATSLVETPDEVFIFGLERPDVRTVDYDAVAMLHVSATQALARQVEELHQQNATLQAQSATLHEQLQAQRAECSQTRAALEQLQAQVASLLSAPVAAIGTPAFAPSAS